jgi:hypothetical protein
MERPAKKLDDKFITVTKVGTQYSIVTLEVFNTFHTSLARLREGDISQARSQQLLRMSKAAIVQ